MEQSQVDKIKTLRSETMLPITACKQALEKANWDMGGALEEIRHICAAFAAKKATTPTTDSICFIHQIENLFYYTIAHCQTDFVARCEVFTNLLVYVTESHHRKTSYVDYMNRIIMACSSNITIDPISVISGNVYYAIRGAVSKYSGNKIAIVQLEKPDQELGHAIANQLLQIDEIVNKHTILDHTISSSGGIRIKDKLGHNSITEIIVLKNQ